MVTKKYHMLLVFIVLYCAIPAHCMNRLARGNPKRGKERLQNKRYVKNPEDQQWEKQHLPDLNNFELIFSLLPQKDQRKLAVYRMDEVRKVYYEELAAHRARKNPIQINPAYLVDNKNHKKRTTPYDQSSVQTTQKQSSPTQGRWSQAWEDEMHYHDIDTAPYVSTKVYAATIALLSCYGIYLASKPS